MECGLLLALIAIVSVGAVTTPGTTLSAKFNTVSTQIAAAGGS
ncbi:MAG: Flp family type IVb pilin [Desulfobaccales bacterium]